MNRTIVNAMHVPIDGEAAEIIAALKQRKQRKLAATPPSAAPSSADPIAKALAALVSALGLPPDADPQDAADALDEYLAGAPAGALPLTAQQMKICSENGITPKAFLSMKKARR